VDAKVIITENRSQRGYSGLYIHSEGEDRAEEELERLRDGKRPRGCAREVALLLVTPVGGEVEAGDKDNIATTDGQ